MINSLHDTVIYCFIAQAYSGLSLDQQVAAVAREVVQLDLSPEGCYFTLHKGVSQMPYISILIVR